MTPCVLLVLVMDIMGGGARYHDKGPGGADFMVLVFVFVLYLFFGHGRCQSHSSNATLILKSIDDKSIYFYALYCTSTVSTT